MYDNLHLHFFLPQPLHHFEKALLESAAFQEWNGDVGEHGRIRIQFRGLRIEYHQGHYWGRVRGSLHTFAQGSNVGVFTAADVAAACADLAVSLNLPPEVFVVRKLEAGINLPVPTSPKEFLGTLVHHKGKKFYAVLPPSGVTRPLEFVALHSEYKLKYYDKGAYALRQEVPLPEGCHHLLRFEVVFTRARGLHQLTGCKPLTLADLPTVEVLSAMADCLHQRWWEAVRRVPLDYTGLSNNHASLLYSGSDLDWWEAVRATTPPSTYKSRRILYLRLQQEAVKKAGPHPYDLLLPEHLQVLRPSHRDGSEPEISTFLHTCNQLEIEEGEQHKKQGEALLWRGSSPSTLVGERLQDKLPAAMPILRAQKAQAHEVKRGKI